MPKKALVTKVQVPRTVDWKKKEIYINCRLKCQQKWCGYPAKWTTGCHFSAIFFFLIAFEFVIPLLICPLSIWQTWMPFPSIFVCHLNLGKMFSHPRDIIQLVWCEMGTVVNKGPTTTLTSLALPAKESFQLGSFILTYLDALFLVSKIHFSHKDSFEKWNVKRWGQFRFHRAPFVNRHGRLPCVRERTS